MGPFLSKFRVRLRGGSLLPDEFTLRMRQGSRRVDSRAPCIVGRGRVTRPPTPVLQRVTAKLSYEPISRVRPRLDYIRNEEKSLSGRESVCFDAKSNRVDGDAVVDRWIAAGDAIFFKLPLNPEKPDQLVSVFMRRTGLAEPEAKQEMIRQMARSVMADVSKDLGTEVDWLASGHFDTRPHVHVLFRGVTDDGRPIRISPDYVKDGFRLRAAQWATRTLGEFRTEQEIADGIAKSQRISQEVEQGRARIDAARAAGAISRTEAFHLSRDVTRGDASREKVLHRLREVDRISTTRGIVQ